MTVGLAVTLDPEVELNPVAGDQEYVEAPVAVKVVDDPIHTVPELTVTVGVGVTDTVVWAVPLHPLSVPVTV